MRKLLFICSLFIFSLIYAEAPKGQIFPINEDANEEIIVINNSPRKEAFKIWCHVKDGSSVSVGMFSVDVNVYDEGWFFTVKTPDVRSGEKWKSSTNYPFVKLSNRICIESKSGIKYNYTFETKHDKLYITVSNYKEGDDW